MSPEQAAGVWVFAMTAGELRKALQDVPDDYVVVADNIEADDCEVCEVRIDRLYEPRTVWQEETGPNDLPGLVDMPGLLILGGGQIISHELGYHSRMDAVHETGRGEKTWALNEEQTDYAWKDRA